MADICMCEGIECPAEKRERCYRFTANANSFRQSYFLLAPIRENGECDEFIDNGGWK